MSVQTDIKQRLSQLQFHLLPRFADFLLQQHLEAFSSYQVQLLKELKVPLLRAFEGFDDAQLLQISMQGSRDLLQALAQNQARNYIEAGMERWKKNAVPQVKKKRCCS